MDINGLSHDIWNCKYYVVLHQSIGEKLFTVRLNRM